MLQSHFPKDNGGYLSIPGIYELGDIFHKSANISASSHKAKDSGQYLLSKFKGCLVDYQRDTWGYPRILPGYLWNWGTNPPVTSQAFEDVLWTRGRCPPGILGYFPVPGRWSLQWNICRWKDVPNCVKDMSPTQRYWRNLLSFKGIVQTKAETGPKFKFSVPFGYINKGSRVPWVLRHGLITLWRLWKLSYL